MYTKEEREGILWEFHRSGLSAPAACRSLPLFPNKDNLYAWLKLEEADELTAREMPDRAECMHCSHGEGSPAFAARRAGAAPASPRKRRAEGGAGRMKGTGRGGAGGAAPEQTEWRDWGLEGLPDDPAERARVAEVRPDDVGVREGQYEEAQAGADAGNVEIGLAEVGLGPAGLPHQVEEPLALGAVPPPQLCNVAADGGLAGVGAVLVDQPAPYAPGGVSLLAPVPGVVLELLTDDGLVRVELARCAPPRGRPRGEVVLGEVLVDGVARYAVHLDDIRDAEPVAALLAYRIDGGHVDHCLSYLSE